MQRQIKCHIQSGAEIFFWSDKEEMPKKIQMFGYLVRFEKNFSASS